MRGNITSPGIHEDAHRAAALHSPRTTCSQFFTISHVQLVSSKSVRSPAVAHRSYAANSPLREDLDGASEI